MLIVLSTSEKRRNATTIVTAKNKKIEINFFILL
jgi:hypothetical protein